MCPPAAKAVVRDGGFAAIIKAMSHHGIDHDACVAIVTIIVDLEPSDVQYLLERAPDTLHTIVASMQRNSDYENLHLAAAGALELLTSKTDAGGELICLGGVSVLVASMKKFPLNIGIQEAACGTIANLPQYMRAVLYTRQVSGVTSLLFRSLLLYGSWNDGTF